MKIYAVIDTNVLVASLLTGRADSPTVKVVQAISEGTLIPLYNEEIMAEYDEVLHRKKFPFTDRRIRPVLASIRTFGLSVNPSSTGEILPDMDDLIFYEVVMEKREDDAYLVTGNLRHFPPRDYIVTPAEMMALIESGEKQKP
jgi:putative PIN family toxin of toxin-antitoxin system